MQLAVAVTLLRIVSGASIVKADHLLRSKRHIVIEGGAMPSTLNLRVCNAFTDKTPVALVLKPAAQDALNVDLTKEGPLQYKSCKDWPVNLRRGDSLEFQQHGSQLGAFAVTSVPQWDTTLLLIIRRKGSSPRPVFASHVFGKTQNSQVAVLDMYNGPSKHSVVIQSNKEPSPDKKHHKQSLLDTDVLAYDNVVAVGDGNYVCTLGGHAGKASKVALAVLPGENYVAMRVGSEGEPGFPEELVVFPSSASYRVSGLSIMLLAAALLSLLLH